MRSCSKSHIQLTLLSNMDNKVRSQGHVLTKQLETVTIAVKLKFSQLQRLKITNVVEEMKFNLKKLVGSENLVYHLMIIRMFMNLVFLMTHTT